MELGLRVEVGCWGYVFGLRLGFELGLRIGLSFRVGVGVKG